MPISLVQSVAGDGAYTGADNLQVSLTVTAGNSLLVGLVWAANVTISTVACTGEAAPTALSPQLVNTGPGRIALLHLGNITTSGTKTVSVTFSGVHNSSSVAMVAYELSGCDTSSFIAASGSAGGATSGPAIVSLSSTRANSAAITYVSGPAGEPTQRTGYTLRNVGNVSSYESSAYNLDIGAAGSYSVGMDLAGSGSWDVYSVIINPPSGGGGGVTGAITRTNANDTSAASGSAGSASITGAIARTNANDTSSASGTVSAGGTITTLALKNNTGTLLASTSITKIAAVKLSDMTLAASWTSQSTNSSGVLSLTSASIFAGTDYLLVTSSSDGSAVGVHKYTAA